MSRCLNVILCLLGECKMENVIFSLAQSDIQTVARLSTVWAIAMEEARHVDEAYV